MTAANSVVSIFAEKINTDEEIKQAIKTKNTLVIVSPKKFEAMCADLPIDVDTFKYNFDNNMTKIESGENYDFIMICAPKQIFEDHTEKKSAFYLETGRVIVICTDTKELYSYLSKETFSKARKLGIEKVFGLAIDRLATGDSSVFVSTEKRITELEAEILNEEDDEDFNSEILHLRRRIVTIKGYYEQLEDVCEYIEEDENDIFDDDRMIYFSSITRRVVRRLDVTLNLREYISQIREASQASSDLKQNRLMKVFTVITSIFMPLTLITSWYGMNLKMPEFGWSWYYPVIICICVVIGVFSMFLFKRKKWF